MNKKQFTENMKAIAEGGKVSQETYDDMVAYAKKAKTKRPPADAVEAKPAKKAAKKAAQPKAPKEKAQCKVTRKEDPKLPEGVTRCPNPARAGGMCATHYSRLIYRAVPANAEKARQASKNYAAKKRAEKKAADASAA